MNSKIKKSKEKDFNELPLSIEKVADADTVIGKSIITVSGTQVIPLSSVTVVNLSGGGEYGDVKTFKEADGFKLAGGNGAVISVKPQGFLVDDGKTCRLLKMEESPLDSLIGKTGDLVHKITDNV
ncbi:MAG: hypothetical protein K2H30_07045 [Clostridia bacterium]|nr:hypothetical protein [Clostridia bacterium]